MAGEVHSALERDSGGLIMVVTDEMLQAAMQKAVETGLLPKFADPETYLKRWDGMKQCIQAALDAAPVQQGQKGA